jgi:amino acid adenylation domain-containing protein
MKIVVSEGGSYIELVDAAQSDQISKLTELLANLFAEILKLDSVGPTDDFFALGGTSISAMRLMAQLSTRLGETYPISAILCDPSPSAIAAAITACEKDLLTIVHQPEIQTAPVSIGQKEIWIAHEREPESAAYNVAFALDIGGDLNIPALQEGWNYILEKHAVLRTRISRNKADPIQIIESEITVPLGIEKIPEASDEELDAVLSEHSQRPFNIEAAPLVRSNLFVLGETRSVLLIVFHHMIIDEWSIGIILDDLAHFYREYPNNAKNQATEIQNGEASNPLFFVDFARWQTKAIRSGMMEQQLDYWSNVLTGATPEIALPRDLVSLDNPGSQGDSVNIAIPEILSERIRELARNAHISEFTWVLSAVAAYLYRISNQADFVIGTPFAARSIPAVQNIVGYFLNTLPLRFRVDGRQTFSEFSHETQSNVHDAMENSDVPYSHLIETLRPTRDKFARPFFQVLFANNEDLASDLDFPGLELRQHPVNVHSSKTDLTILTTLSEGIFKAKFEFNTSVFNRATAESMAEAFRTFIIDLVALPEGSISGFQLMSDEDQERLYAQQNNNKQDYPKDLCIPALFDEVAENRPTCLALKFGDVDVTYGELKSESEHVARLVAQSGIAASSNIAITLPRGPSLIAAMLGVLRAGCTYVPLDPSYPVERLEFMLADSKVKGLIGELPFDQSQLQISPEVIKYNGTVTAGSKPDFVTILSKIDPDHPAYVMYTSGSTGRPKGVVVTHRNITSLLKNVDFVDLSPESRILQISSTSFDASTFEIWGPLLNGGVCVLLQEKQISIDAIKNVVEDHNINCMFITTALFNTLIDIDPSALNGVEQILFGGEAASTSRAAKALHALPNARISNIYGPTENTTFSTCHPLSRENTLPSQIPIGRPISNRSAYILMPDGSPAPFGMPGELFVGGDGVAKGYLNQPKLTAEKFVDNSICDARDTRFYRTGDICRMSRNGIIDFIGRADDQLKIRGHRIELGEIEECLVSFKGISQAVVAPRQTPANETVLSAYVVAATSESDLLQHEIVEHVRRYLPSYMVPSSITEIAKVPLGPTGKIDRNALPHPETEQAKSNGPSEPLQSDLERGMAAVWSNVLSVNNVGVNDSFFSLGGTSLIALGLISEMERQLGLQIELNDIFAFPSIRELLANRKPDMDSLRAVMVPLNTKIEGRPLFCLSSIGNYQELGYALDGRVRILGVFVAKENQLLKQFEFASERQTVTISLEELVEEYCEAIIKQQPEGPYRVAGLSFGGVLAYEVAKSLIARGHGVESVLFFDTVLPRKGIWWSLKHLKTIFKPVAEYLGIGRKGTQEPHGSGANIKTIYSAINAAYTKALEEYKPEPSLIDSRVLFIKAADTQLRPDVDVDYGWDKEIFSNFEIVACPGAHLTLLRNENVELVSDIVAKELGNESA